MSDDKPYQVTIDPIKTGSSLDQFKTGVKNEIMPERLVLHELIVQTVSERKILPTNSIDYEGRFLEVIQELQELPSYQALEQAGDYRPEKIAGVLDEIGLERLSLHAQAEQVMMITGAPGTGKSSLVEKLSKDNPDIYRDAVQINPDHYKDILANPKDYGAAHATFTHQESSILSNKIMDRLQQRMQAGLPAPHVMMDVVGAYLNRMAFAKEFGKMTVVMGTAPAEVTIERAYKRGFDTDGNITGRVLPSNVAIGGAANASRLLTTVFDHPNLEMTIVNTDVPKGELPTTVAELQNGESGRRFAVYDGDAFTDLLFREDINTGAQHAGELYDEAKRTPQRLAERLQEFTDKGVAVDFYTPDNKVGMSIEKNAVHLHEALPMKQGAGFMADVADSLKGLGKHSGLIGGVVLSGAVGVFTLAAGGSEAQAAEAMYETAMPYGETQLDLVGGDIEAAKRSATVETASNIGSVGGTLAMAATGAALGSVVPVIGTGIGAFAFGLIGAFGGGWGAAYVTELVYDNFKVAEDSEPNVPAESAEQLTVQTSATGKIIAQNDNLSPEAFFDRERLSQIAVTDDIPPELHALIEAEALLTKAEAAGKQAQVVSAANCFDDAKEALMQSPYVKDSMDYAQMHQDDDTAAPALPVSAQETKIAASKMAVGL